MPSNARYNPYTHERQPLFQWPASTPSPAIPVRGQQAIDQETQVRRHAKAREVENLALDTSIAEFSILDPVRFPALLTEVSLLTFQIPAGRVMVADRIDIKFSEPFCYLNSQFGWRLVVNAGQIPFHRSQGQATGRNDVLFMPFNGNADAAKISPVYVQEESTASIQLIELSNTNPPDPFDESLAAAVWLYATFYKPVGGMA